MPRDVSSFAKKNGFIWGPEPEIYNGLAGFYTYGPMGKALKTNVEDSLRKVFDAHEFWEVETPIIAPARVWKASGHLAGFTDPVIRDSDNNIFRADKLIEEYLLENGVNPDEENVGSLNAEALLKLIKKYDIKSPNGKMLNMNIENHNLMMKTTIGTDIEAYSRPETATTTYLPFRNYHDYFRKKMPMKIYQVGKSFRNEISPRQSVIRGREFTQFEAQLFLFENEKHEFEDYDKIKDVRVQLWPSNAQLEKKGWNSVTLKDALKKSVIKNKSYAWALSLAQEFVDILKIPSDRVRYRQHHPDEKAFYSNDTWDLEFRTDTFGWIEIAGISDRNDYDLTQHAKASGQKLNIGGETPHIIELAFGSDRIVYTLLDVFLDEEKVGKDMRVIWRIPKELAPVRFAVFPLQNKDGLPEKAREVYEVLSKNYRCLLDVSGSIGKRYRRQDERGTPHCITIDYDTIKDDTVTLRDRDTMEQKRIKINDLKKVDVS
ncbi:MAG: glycine--tRNA ligase [uncultured DHVE6 group euryarchaeote]|jgi:glycyl-tRNA synthetase|nr:MAG: glycine--tRNA ligase [uncultured DHVE6 group euryarchaeote]